MPFEPNGLYITRDSGVSWEHPLTEQIGAVTLASNDSSRVYAAGLRETLYASEDRGRTWKVIGQFDRGTSIRSLYVASDGTLFVGLHWADFRKPTTAEGIYILRDQGTTWQFSSFGTAHRGLIVWDIAQDLRDGTLYAGTEIYDHPKPYKPPFLRSKDTGKTWQEISGTLPWHVVKIQVRSDTGQVYALTEGYGLYTSSDQGERWNPLGTGPVFELVLDPNYPDRLFGGAFGIQGQRGGVFYSTNGGATFERIGLNGVTVGSIGLNGDSTSVYAVVYASGIYVSRVPK